MLSPSLQPEIFPEFPFMLDSWTSLFYFIEFF